MITKTIPPQHSCEIVSRPRLNKLLDKGSQLRASFITAPAGYGKTTLLIDYIEETSMPLCWYSLTSVDKSPPCLLGGIIAAICERYKDLEGEVRVLISGENKQLCDIKKDIEKLSLRIEQLINADILFVIEDFSEVEESPDSIEVIEKLLSSMPDNCHFIITSRSDICLPSALKFIMRKKAIRISTGMLALNDKEIKELINKQYKIKLTANETVRLAIESGGWPITLLLDMDYAVNSSAEDSPPLVLAENDIFNFFEVEILKKQTKEIKDFLLISSLFDEISPYIYKKTRPRTNTIKIINNLVSQNLLAKTRNAGESTYNYHPLFRKYLRMNLQQSNERNYFKANKEIADVYSGENIIHEAINHYLLARDYNSAINLINENGNSFMEAGKWDVVAKWIEAMPDKLQNSNNETGMLYARCLVHLGLVHKAIKILNKIVFLTIGGSIQLLRAEALSWRSAAFRLTSHFKEAKRDIVESIAILEQSDNPVTLTGEAYRRLGSIYMEQGYHRKALKYLKYALTLYSKEHIIDKMADAHNTLGIVYKKLGKLHKANTHYEMAREGWQKVNNTGALASTLNNMGTIYQRLGQYDLALEVLNEGLECAKNAGYLRMEACILIALAEVQRDSGNYKKAINTYNQGLYISRNVMESYFIAYATAGLGKTYMLLGDNKKAEYLVEEAINYAREKGQQYDASVFQLDLAIIRLSEGDLPNAEKIINQVTNKIIKTDDKDALVRVYYYSAKIAFYKKDYKICTGYLSLLQKVADELGYDDFLVTEGRNAMPLLQYGAIKFPESQRFENAVKRLNSSRRQRDLDLGTGIVSSEIELVSQDIRANAFDSVNVSYGNSKNIFKVKWRSNKAKEFFFYLLLYKQGRTKEQIIDAIWPDTNLDNTDNNFHITLYRVRNALFPHIFTIEKCLYKINNNLRIWFDVELFESYFARAESIRKLSDEKIKLLEKAVKLYRGNFMDGFYSDWIDVKRHELEIKYLRALSLLADIYKEKGEIENTIVVLEKLINIDPYQEVAYKKLMECHGNLGDDVAVSSVYKKYIKFVVDEMGQEAST